MIEGGTGHMERQKCCLACYFGLELLAYVQYRYSWPENHGALPVLMVGIGLDHVCEIASKSIAPLLLFHNDHCLQIGSLLHLRLNFLNDRCEIWFVLEPNQENRHLSRRDRYVHPQVGCVQKLEEVDAQASTGQRKISSCEHNLGRLENVLGKLSLA